MPKQAPAPQCGTRPDAELRVSLRRSDGAGGRFVPRRFGSLRRWVKHAWIGVLFATGALAWAKRQVARRGLVVLTFHRVLCDAERQQTQSQSSLVVTDYLFEALLRHIVANYEIVDLQEAGERVPPPSSKPRLAITFDDGWCDNAQVAFPITQRYGVPLTIFLSTGRLGRWFPFWPERVGLLVRRAEATPEGGAKLMQLIAMEPTQQLRGALLGPDHVNSLIEALKTLSSQQREDFLRRLQECTDGAADGARIDATMNWEQVLQMHRNGVVFGSHTHNHGLLPYLSREEIIDELSNSKQAIERHLGIACRLFAYPNGDASAPVRQLVAESGYQLAFLNEAGVWTAATDPLLIPRVNISQHAISSIGGHFSRHVFEYTAFWKPYRTMSRASAPGGNDTPK